MLVACGGGDPKSSGDSGGGTGGGSAGGTGGDAAAASAKPGEGDFVAYSQKVGDSDVSIEMVPVGGGTFLMGSPSDEEGREDHEGPQVEVTVEPFWMGKYEIRWDEYDVWNTDESRPQSKKPDGVARPTPAYMEMTFNMGRQGYPAICMSHVAARQYCKWLSEQTGEFYRLPTEAEWEYACRAGSKTPYSVDAAKLGDVAWYSDNSPRVLEDGAQPEKAYRMVGKKQANAFGLYDMHGNVAEWVADYYHADLFDEKNGKGPRLNPYMQPLRDKRDRPKRWSHVARGGSWKQEAAELRSAARLSSEPDWNQRDPQIPKSWWYLTDAQHIGFRIVRPLKKPSGEERAKFENP